MENNRLLHELELAFFGKITASISHELNNVLSIINEYSGLLDDLILAENQGRPVEKERIQKIALNIAEQIKREQKIIKLLNRFAHRVDTPIVQFNLNELVNDIIRLSRRFASLKKVTLEVSLPEQSINMTNSPFSVQHAIFSCLSLALDFSDSNDNITTKLGTEDSQAIIKITSRTIEMNEHTKKKLGSISLILKNVVGKIDTLSLNDDSHITKLIIPLAMPDDVK
jgi:signal transduction histidine kinase